LSHFDFGILRLKNIRVLLPKMKKLLVICGPTATGKTSLALLLAKKFNGEIVSADSRQVYKNMDIGTGKDLPQGSKWHLAKFPIGFWETKNHIRIWGYDLVSPKEEFSVSKYVEIAKKIIFDIEKRGKLPILVGGTGLYIKSIVDGIPTAIIPKNSKIRKRLEGKNVDDLFENLAQLDSTRAASLNISDRKNPRRLIRAIEVALWRVLHKRKKQIEKYKEKRDILMIGLTMPRESFNSVISRRIEKRLQEGIEEEIMKLLLKGISWEHQSMGSLGYRQLKSYILEKESKNEAMKRWFLSEKNYAKRQITWFKKDKRIKWFDFDKSHLQKDVEKLVRSWYYNGNAKKN